MLAIWVYISYTARPWAMRYLALLVCFALGLMAKPMLVTLPFVLLLLDYWPLRRIGRKKPSIRPLLAEKVPLFVLAGLSSIVTYLVQYHGGAVKALPPGARPGNAFVSSIAYIVKIFWPANLAVLYPYPERLPLWKVAGAAAILFALTALALKAAKKCPYATVGWFWHLGTLVPVIGIVQVGSLYRGAPYQCFSRSHFCQFLRSSAWGMGR
jgi:hypothetical protein